MARGIVDSTQLRGQVCGVAMVLCFLAGPVSLSTRLSANERGEPVRIEVFPESIICDSVRDSMQFVVTGHYADGTVLDLTRETTLVVEDEEIARVDGSVVYPVFPKTTPAAGSDDEPAYHVTEVFDLRKDFSTTANPNGAWSFEALGDHTLLSLYDSNALGGLDAPHKPNPAWRLPVRAPPLVATALDPEESGMPHDLDTGDIFGHGPVRIRWTAPRDGVVLVSGHA